MWNILRNFQVHFIGIFPCDWSLNFIISYSLLLVSMTESKSKSKLFVSASTSSLQVNFATPLPPFPPYDPDPDHCFHPTSSPQPRPRDSTSLPGLQSQYPHSHLHQVQDVWQVPCGAYAIKSADISTSLTAAKVSFICFYDAFICFGMFCRLVFC